MKFLNIFFSWLRSVYSEPDGSGSSTRVHIGMIFAFILGVGTAFAVSTYKSKMTIDQFNSFLGSAGNFILVTGGPLYGANKLADWAKNKNQNQTTQPGA